MGFSVIWDALFHVPDLPGAICDRRILRLVPDLRAIDDSGLMGIHRTGYRRMENESLRAGEHGDL